MTKEKNQADSYKEKWEQADKAGLKIVAAYWKGRYEEAAGIPVKE